MKRCTVCHQTLPDETTTCPSDGAALRDDPLLGDWETPFGVPPFIWVPAPLWFLLKTVFVMFCILWVRATFPRFRYDQLMRLGWKVFLPFTLFWLVLTAGALTAFGWVPAR